MQARLTGRPGANQAVPLHRGLECHDHVGHRGGAVENLELTVIPHEGRRRVRDQVELATALSPRALGAQVFSFLCAWLNSFVSQVFSSPFLDSLPENDFICISAGSFGHRSRWQVWLLKNAIARVACAFAFHDVC
jgi:hypothetical protein